MKYIILIVVILIFAKTGSLGKVFKFLFRKTFLPALFAVVGGVVGYLVAQETGAAIGIIAGAIFAWVTIIKKTKQDIQE